MDPANQDDLSWFVASWMSLGSVAEVARETGLTCDDVCHLHALLNRAGVSLPPKPVPDPGLAADAGVGSAAETELFPSNP